MQFKTIISAQQLNSIIENDSVRVFDCRFSLKDPQGGLKSYQAGHLPGAQFADMDTQLSAPMTQTSGRHPLPEPEKFAEQLQAWGVNNDTQVIAYDDMSGAFAARLWWMMRWLGHDSVAVLDGGLPKWTEAGYALAQESGAFAPGAFKATANMRWLVDIDSVQRRLAADSITLIDARSADRFTGKDQKTDPVPGHIPGAKNLPFAGNLDQNGLFQNPQAIRARFAAVIQDQSGDKVVNMCGSGVTACHNLLAQAVAGLPPGRLFVGSWSQWIRDPSRPVAGGQP